MRLIIASLVLNLNILNTSLAQEKSDPWKASETLVEKLQKQKNDFNYRESDVPKFELPAALISQDGTQIKTREDWKKIRRPELMEMFRSQV